MRLAALALLAALLHLALDWLFHFAEWSSPPHLLVRHAPEVFQMLSPMAVGIAASAVNGVISLVALLSVASAEGGEPARRTLVLGLVLWGFWILSEGLLALVWLSAPPATVIGGLVFGLPRSLLVAWLLGRAFVPAAGR